MLRESELSSFQYVVTEFDQTADEGDESDGSNSDISMHENQQALLKQ